MNYIEKFKISVEKNKDKVAIVDTDGKRSISYTSLDILSGKIANKLHENGVKKGDKVIVHMDRTMEYVATTLGILKVGAVIVPTVLDYPKERIDYIKNMSEAKLIIEEDFVKDIEKYDVYEDLASDKDGAIIYFTSGSTGNPKGILHTIYDLSNATDRHSIYFEGIDKLVTACMVPFSFGMYLFDFFYALNYGATIHILSDVVRKDIRKIEEYYKKHNITLCFLSPQQLRLFKSQSKSLKRVITGSERVINAFSRDYETYVLYGSTEAMVGFTYFRVDKNYDNTPIGKVLNGLKYIILDENGKKVKVGNVGELCIEYDTYSSYYKDEEKTKKVFEKLPDGKILYHTGDLVLENEDKNLVFVNRKDFMVKINGQRVEPYEIESIIQNVENIKSAVVKSFEDENRQTYLVGYYESDKDLKDIIDEKLRLKLPYYMIPRYLVRLDMMPKNANGKIDRLSLMPPDISLFKNEYVAPRNEMEKAICDAFSKIIGVDKVGIKDDFFTIGGDSIKTLKLADAIEKYNVSVNIINNGRTPENIAKLIIEGKEKAIKSYGDIKEAPLNFSQQGVYLECFDDKDTVKYNISFYLTLTKNIDLDEFEKAVKKVINTHDILNAHIVNKDKEIKLIIEDREVVIDRKKTDDIEKDSRLYIKPFDLENGPLYRCTIFEGKEYNYFMFDVHHIVFDGTSLKVFVEDISKVYDGYNIQKEKLTAFDVAINEKDIKNKEAYKEALSFYDEKFVGVEALSTPISNIVENVDANDKTAETIKINIGKYINKIDIEKFVKENGITENVLFISAFAYTLAKFNYSKDTMFTIGNQGRPDGRLNNSIGMFVKTLPLYYEIDDECLVREFLSKSNEYINLTKTNDIVSFADLVSQYDINNEVSFVFQSTLYNDVNTKDGNIKINLLDNSEVISEISMMLMKTQDEYDATLIYKKVSYTKTIMENLLHMYINVIKGMITCKKLKDIIFVREEDINKITEFNKTEVPYDEDTTVVEKFRQNAKKFADKIALVSKNKKFTYKDLDVLTDKIATYIIKEGGTKEKVVGVLVDRDEYMAICALSALKANCAYLPLDPTYPPERLNFMMEDSTAFMLIADDKYKSVIDESFKGKRVSTTFFDSLTEVSEKLPSPDKNDLFSFVYTSGTTGKPKGVMVEHKNVMCLVAWCNRFYNMDENTKATSYASYGFDANLKDMYPVLCAGGELHIIPDEMRLDLNAVKEYFNDNKITQSVMTTQVARQFAQMDDIKTLRFLMAGGEKLVPIEPPKNFSFCNGYGPCECTVLVSQFIVDKKYRDVPVGKAIDNVKLYVIDSVGRLLPVGAAGELIASGPHVTRGYLNRPDKTNEAYGDNLFSKDKGYERVYRTGDVLRFLDDGTLQYIGRRDSQVKVRGFRVELTEIEEVIRRYKNINDATVVAFDDANGGKYLVAYVVSDVQIDTKDIATFIKNEKPPYMVPAIIMQIPKIPYTQNQKVNKRALPTPERKVEDIIKPTTEIQKTIFDIIKDILGNDDFGINTDIYDAGLTSIGAVRLNVELSKKFDIPMKMVDLKENSTIEKLEQFFIKKDDVSKNISFTDIRFEEGEYPLTETQNGIFVESTQIKDSVTYNIPVLFKVSKKINQQKLIEAIYKTLKKHPYLNARIIMKDNGDIRTIKKEVDDNVVEVINSDVLPNEDILIRPYDILKDRLYRIEIYNVKKESDVYYLFIEMHHIISDGSSINIFMQDIINAYYDKDIKEEIVSGFDIGIEELKDRNSDYYNKAKEYFNKLFSDVEINTMPIKCPDTTGGVGDLSKKGSIDIEKVKKYCDENKVSINAFCNAVFGYVLSRYCYKDEVVFSTIYNGRNDTRYERTISMLVKTLPVVYKANKTEKVQDYIKNTQNQLLESMSHDIYSFAEIKKEYGVNADVMFVYQGDNFDMNFSDNLITSKDISLKAAKAPITFELSIKNNKFDYHLTFEKEKFSWDFINSFIHSYEVAIENFLKEEYVKNVSLLSDDIREKIAKYNDYKIPYENVPIHVLFEKQVALHKDRPCYIVEDKVFTYDEINKKANRIANFIISTGIKKNSIIGIFFDRTENIPVSQYGVMKAGCAFTALIPDYPDDRIDFCLRNAEAPIVITTEKLKEERKELFSDDKPYKTYTVEEIEKDSVDTNPNLDISPDTLAYCIYTSGTTGTPKGVLIRHDNITNFVQTNMIARSIKNKDGSPMMILALANVTFDGSMCEHVTATTMGNTVCLTKENDIHNPLALTKLIIKNKIDFMFATPSLMATLVDMEEFHPAIRQLKVYLSAAESITKSLISKIKSVNKNVLILNGYGPSECTIGCNEKIVKTESDTDIGIPAPNTKLYVIDKDKNQLPFYALGEIVIGGVCVGSGYIKLPEKNEKVFIEYDGGRAYCCGDVVRQKNNGCFDFFGRIDNLVKVHGYRIELDEIEKVIGAYPGILRYKVLVRNNGTEDYLCAFFTASKKVDLKDLTKFLKSKLTYYMVPAAIMQLEEMPLNASGKIDKTKLPEIVKEKKEKKVSKKQLVNDIVEVFKVVLNLEEYDPEDDFFSMGGTSLSASKVTMKLLTKNIQVDYGDIFDHPTPEDLASFIEEKTGIKQEEVDEETYDDIKKEYAKIPEQIVLDVLKYNNMKYAKEVKTESLGDVLLTGANGFLGVHILRELLQEEKGHIYCVIRKGSFSDSVARLKNVLFYYFDKSFKEEFENRITILDMDLTDEDLLDKLKDIKIDTIINAAACVKHYANDDFIEKINVYGVENLIKVALNKNARLTQISTSSVPGVHTAKTYDAKISLYEDDLFMVDTMDNKYILSKYKAETRVFTAISQDGLVGKVIRVGNLMGRNSDGEFQINSETNAFLNALKGFATLKHSPISHATDPMRFSPIDCTAKAVVLLSKTNEMFTAFNAENRFGFDEMQLIDACNRNGIEIKVIPDEEHYDDYNKKMADDRINKRLAALLTNDKPGLHMVEANNEFTANILYRIGFSWPLVERDYLDKVIISLKTLGFFDDDEIDLTKGIDNTVE